MVFGWVKEEVILQIFDGHSDIFTDVLRRRLAGEKDVLARVHLPRLRAGGIEGGCLVLWVDPPHTNAPLPRFRALCQAVREELAACGEAVLVHNCGEIAAARAQGRFYILLGTEGLDAIGEDDGQIDALYDFGVRHAMLTWNNDNALAGGAKGDPSRGLTAAGRRVLARLEAWHMLVDVSHLGDASFWDVLGAVHGPLIASHSNARSVNAVPRNLDDDQLRAVAATGGLVGLNAFKGFVAADAAQQTLDTFVRHAVHIAETIGTAHLALGFDFNDYLHRDAMASYNDAANPNVPGLEDASRAQAFITRLRTAGFSEAECEAIAWRNWHRLIETVLG